MGRGAGRAGNKKAPAAARRVAGEVLHAPAADFFPDTRDTAAMFVAPPFPLKQLIRNANVAEDTEELYKGGCRVLLVELLCDSLLVTAIVQHTRTVGARVAPAASLEQIGRGLLPQVQQQPQVPHAHTTRAPQRLTPLARTRYVTSIRATPPAPTPRGVYPMKLSLTNAHARTALADVGVWRYSVTLKDVRADPDLAKRVLGRIGHSPRVLNAQLFRNQVVAINAQADHRAHPAMLQTLDRLLRQERRKA